jgi:hypothetical protein
MGLRDFEGFLIVCSPGRRYAQELAAGKAALEVKVSELLSKGKTQSAKIATMEKELERSKALAVNLTKELQVRVFALVHDCFFS